MDAVTSASWLVNLLKANMPCARDAIGHIKALSVLWSTFQKLCLPSCMILKLSVQLSLLIVVIIHSIREAFSFFFYLLDSYLFKKLFKCKISALTMTHAFTVKVQGVSVWLCHQAASAFIIYF